MELEYDLYSLPTSQHRAGLAGLVLLARLMARMQLPNAPLVEADGPLLRVTLEEGQLVALFNLLYDATTVERREPRARKDEQPLRVDTETVTDQKGKVSERQRYIYPQLTPAAGFLSHLQMPDAWLKLWRDVVWSTLRGIPKTRGPYEQRRDGKDVAEARRLWTSLQRWEKRQRTTAEPIAGPIFVGAMAKSAEDVPFVDSPDRVLLLHCWQAVMGVGEALRYKLDRGELKEEPFGYVVVIPDVLDIEDFIDTYTASLANLDPTVAGHRPRAAVLATPVEGGLEYLTALAAGRAAAGEQRFALSGVDVYCLRKEGNTIPVLATGRVPADTGMVQAYRTIREGYANLTFRQQLVTNLLARRPWHTGFERLFAVGDAEMFFGAGVRGFAFAAAKRFGEEFSTRRGA